MRQGATIVPVLIEADVPSLSIVVPVYKSESTIRVLVDNLSKLTPEGGLEIILVDDGSPDAAGSVCRELLRKATVPITLVEHARNFGEHNAVLSGLRHARGSFVVTMDDDLQNPPDAAIKLYEHALNGKWDVVYARYDNKQHSRWRNAGSWFANRVADILLPKPKGLYLSSFRCMSSFLVRNITKYRGPFPYIDGLILQATDRISTLPVVHLDRGGGRSTYTLPKLIGLWLNMSTGFSLVPLRAAMFIGAALTILAAICAAGVIIQIITANEPPSLAAIGISLILLIGGVQSFLFGILGEYVGRMLLLSSRKPQAVVRSVSVSEQRPGKRTTRASR
jgi:glycosyltransferase involved in cell wall biosynthesis